MNDAHHTDGNIQLERRDHLLLIGLNRPAKYNAFSLTMFRQLGAALGELESDPDLRCGLLYGLGDHFTAGIDLAQWADVFASGQWPELPEGALDPMGLQHPPRTKPLVVAVQGICFTIGIELMLACDIRVAARDTRFAQIEIKRGIYPVGGATLRFHMETGWGNAMRYLLTGDEFNGDEAYRLGLIQEVAEADEVFERALSIAQTIAKQAPLGVYATLKSARLTRYAAEQAALAHLMPDLIPLMQSDDAQEGVQSFIERREANFRGK